MALDKTDGRKVWASRGLSAGPEYSSCVPVVPADKRDASSPAPTRAWSASTPQRRLLWGNPFAADNTANCPTPAYSDGYVFWANGYGKGGICMKLGRDGKASEAWTTARHGLPPRRLHHRQAATSTATTKAAGPAWT